MTDDYVHEAAYAHTNLRVFAVVKDIIESGATYGCGITAGKISKLCDTEMQHQLRLYDKFVAKAKRRINAATTQKPE